MRYPRTIVRQLVFLSEHFPVVFIGGARQTGKTTLLKETIVSRSGVNYVTLGDMRTRLTAKTDPELFLQTYPAPVVIDEIQYAPELLPYIKIRVDEDRTPGQYFLTGSQLFRLMKGVTESLAGRVGLLSLFGLSRAEIAGTPETPFLPTNERPDRSKETVESVFERIFRGSMPQMVVDPELPPDSYFGEYVQTYLERDVRDLMEVRNMTAFQRFISCAAARTGQELNLTDIGHDVGVPSITAERWPRGSAPNSR